MTSARPVIFADACVLYPAMLRDVLIQGAVEKAFALRWSADVQKEWASALLANHPGVDASKIARTQSLMDKALPYAEVKGYHFRIASVNLPDPDDRHVLAAAIHGGCNVILSFNLSDFPANALSAHGVEALHPDPFFVRIIENAPLPFIKALRLIRARLKKPAYTAEGLLELLERRGLGATADALRPFLPYFEV
jgi:hypothetical protein